MLFDYLCNLTQGPRNDFNGIENPSIVRNSMRQKVELFHGYLDIS